MTYLAEIQGLSRLVDRHRLRVAALGALTLAGLLLVPLPAMVAGPVIRHAFDLGHIPLFAVTTLVIAALLRGGAMRRTCLAVIASICLAGAAELLQMFVPTREASVDDFLRGILGALIAAAGIACWPRTRLRLGFAAASCGVAAALAWSIVAEANVVRAFDRQMPVLAAFEHEWELERWHPKEATTIARSRRWRDDGEWSLEVRCERAVYPGVSMESFPPDWRAFRFLTWSADVPGSTPLDLTIRIDDDLGDLYGTRFVTVVRLEPGARTYRVDLNAAAKALPEHALNLAKITEVHWFLDHPEAPRTFLLDGVRLER